MEKSKKGILIISKKRNLIILYILVVAILFGIGFYGIYKVLNVKTIYEGVKIDEFDVSNKTKEEALECIKVKREEDLSEKQMNLKYGENVYTVSLKDLGFKYDYDNAVDNAYKIGRDGNFINRLKTIKNIKKNGKVIELESGYDKELIDKYVSTIKEDLNVESRNAVFNFNGGNIQVSEEVVGREVDEKALKTAMEDNIYKLDDIEIPVNIVEPKVKKEFLSRINGIIGEFSTSLGRSNIERKNNIRVASNEISGTLVMPKETVSFNELTGPRSEESGYKEANVIVNGEFLPGLGGGVCQVSTTLYNALLCADLSIVERTNHSIPVSYVDLGQDATVSFGNLDLKFRNDFDFPVYINMKVSEDRVYAYIYGDRNSKDYEVNITSEIVEKVPPETEIIKDKNLKSGKKELVQSGREGYKVKTYKQVVKNGKVIKEEQITSDFYKPLNYIYKVGTKK